MIYIPGVMMMSEWWSVYTKEEDGVTHTRSMVKNLLKDGLYGDRNEMGLMDI